MKSSELFKQTIQAYLERRASSDELFAVSYARKDRNIDDCVTYILNTVQKSGCSGFADEEIYSMAVHYYIENNVEVGEKVDCRVVVNHTVELTEEEKQEARDNAVKKLEEETYQSIKRKPVKTVREDKSNQLSLF